jgi:hypothetical protein
MDDLVIVIDALVASWCARYPILHRGGGLGGCECHYTRSKRDAIVEPGEAIKELVAVVMVITGVPLSSGL